MNAFGQTTTILSLSSACWIPWAREEVDEVLSVEDGLEEGLQGLLQLLQLAHNQCTLALNVHVSQYSTTFNVLMLYRRALRRRTSFQFHFSRM